MPKNPQDTLSQPALKIYNQYQEVLTEALAWLRIRDLKDNSITIPTIPLHQKSTLMDYIQGESVTPQPQLKLEKFQSSILHHKYHQLPTIKKGIFSKTAHNLSYEQLHR